MDLKKITGLILIISFLSCQGCYHSRLITNEDPDTDFKKETVNSLFWGLLQENIDAKCKSGVSEARFSTNFGFVLISVISLGIWVPMDVEWKCAVKSPPPIPDQ